MYQFFSQFGFYLYLVMVSSLVTISAILTLWSIRRPHN